MTIGPSSSMLVAKRHSVCAADPCGVHAVCVVYDMHDDALTHVLWGKRVTSTSSKPI